MFHKYKYSDKEQKEILSSIVILIDTREKSNKHIIDYFNKNKISYKSVKLDQGDYSFYIPKNEDMHIDRDVYFNKEIVFERKGSLEELSTNLTKERDRLKTEFSNYKGKMTLLIENSNYEDVVCGNYKSQYSSKSFTASIHSLSSEFNIPVVFMPNKDYSAMYMYLTFYYYLRNIIK